MMINTKVGMCTGMIYNLIRKLTEDKEDILASRWYICCTRLSLTKII